MSDILSPHRLSRLVLTGVSFFALALSCAQAQFRLLPHFRRDCPDVATPAPAPSVEPPPRVDTPPRVTPETEIIPGARTTAALGDRDVAFSPGYLDNPLPITNFRLRFDSAFNNTRPDRAEFFYAKCGCFRTLPVGADPSAAGPPLPETSVDYQDISAYLEVARGDRLSGFIEVPFRFLNPDVNNNTAGLADINLGFKYALIRNDCRVLTFQGRVYVPTGDSDRGLGNDHVSLEPSLLFARNVGDRLTLFGNFGVWIPIDGSDFAGDILRYGVGASYTAVDNGRFSISPVVEVLGWTVLDGAELANPPGVIVDASGDTIVNAKFGVRVGFGGRSDFYVGYGRALTGDTWYRDIVRFEFRILY